MLKQFFSLIFIVSIAGCTYTSHTDVHIPVDSTQLKWTEPIVWDYINMSDNIDVQYAFKNEAIVLKRDQLLMTDTATYIIYHIGAKNSTFQSVYIDTLSKKVYEYDTITKKLKPQDL